MKTHKRFLALLLALALTFSLSACVSLPTKKSTISRMTTTVETGTETDSSAFSLSYEYDERGLASAIELTMDEELMGDDQKLRMELSYIMDDKGNPESVSTLVLGMELRLALENRYEGGRLTEAVITAFSMGDEALLGPGASGSLAQEAASAGAINLVLPVLQNYTGYRSCSLSIEGIGTVLRNEKGRAVYTYMPQAQLATETVTVYASDGGVMRTQNSYRIDGEEKELTMRTVTERDEKGFLRRMEIVNADGSGAAVSLRLEDAGVSAEGRTQKRALVDTVTPIGDPDAWDASQDLDLEKLPGREFELYTLDEAGRVSVCRQNMLLDDQADFFSETTTWYNARGEVTRTETRNRSGEYSSRTVTETEYR